MKQLPVALKLALFLGIMMIAGLSVLSQVTLRSQYQLIEQQFAIFGRSVTQQLAESAVEPLFTEDQLMLDRLVTSLLQVPQVVGAAIQSPDGELLVASGVPFAVAGLTPSKAIADDSPIKQSLPWGIATAETPDAPFVTFFTDIQFKGIRGGNAIVIVSQAEIAMTLQRNRAFLLWSMGSIMVFLLVGIYWISRIIMKPLSALDHATIALGHGDFGYRIQHTFNGEFQRVVNAFNRMAAEIEQKWQAEIVLKRLVPAEVSQQYLPHQTDIKLGSKRIQATIVFADIAGFTSLSEKWAPEIIEFMLNEVFTIMAVSTQEHGGFVDKFIGDEAMMVFGVPEPRDDHEVQAMQTALAIQSRIQQLDTDVFGPGIPPIRLKIGLSSGTVLAGLFGANERMQYTLIGDPVNVASRLTQLAQPGQILTTASLAARVNSAVSVVVSESTPIMVKGKADPIETCSVTAQSAQEVTTKGVTP
jgi:adenylate cyclase